MVDTCIWSAALRRKKRTRSEERLARQLTELINDLNVVVIGAIRQEILSGISDETQFARVRDRLRAFPDLELDTESYEMAARFYNRCRGKGIQGSNTDFLICAAAEQHNLSIFTTDKDFSRYRDLIGIKLLPLD